METKKCINCGAEIAQEQENCPECGRTQQAGEKEAEKPVTPAQPIIIREKASKAPIYIAIAIVLLAAIGFFTYQAIQKKNSEQAAATAAEAERAAAEKAESDKASAVAKYKSDAKSFLSAVLSSGSDLEDVGNDIYEAWQEYVQSKYNFNSLDGIIKDTLYKNRDLVSKIESNDTRIQSLYKSLLSCPDPSDSYLMQIQREVMSLYNDYNDLYNLVLNPSGSYNSWTAEYNSIRSDFLSSYDKLNKLF